MDEENFSELLENWQLGHLLENFQSIMIIFVKI